MITLTNSEDTGIYTNVIIRQNSVSGTSIFNLEDSFTTYLLGHSDHELHDFVEEYPNMEITGYTRQVILHGHRMLQQQYYMGTFYAYEENGSIKYSDTTCLFLPVESSLQFALEAKYAKVDISNIVITNDGMTMRSADYIMVLQEKRNNNDAVPNYRMNNIVKREFNAVPGPSLRCRTLETGGNVEPTEYDAIVKLLKERYNEDVTKFNTIWYRKDDLYWMLSKASKLEMISVVREFVIGIQLRYYVISIIRDKSEWGPETVWRVVLLAQDQFALFKLIMNQLPRSLKTYTLVNSAYPTFPNEDNNHPSLEDIDVIAILNNAGTEIEEICSLKTLL